MLGFIFGTVCLVAFVMVLTRRRRWRYHGFGYGHGCGGRFGRRRHRGLYGMFEELDTSPGQEKAIRAAIGDLRSTLDELLPRFDSARGELAAALRDEQFDVQKVEASLDDRAVELGKLSRALSSALAKAHEALDPDQRRRLARLIEAGAAV